MKRVYIGENQPIYFSLPEPNESNVGDRYLLEGDSAVLIPAETVRRPALIIFKIPFTDFYISMYNRKSEIKYRWSVSNRKDGLLECEVMDD